MPIIREIKCKYISYEKYKITMNYVAKYKEIASKGSRKCRKVRGGGGISRSRDGAVVVNSQLNYVCRNYF